MLADVGARGLLHEGRSLVQKWTIHGLLSLTVNGVKAMTNLFRSWLA